MKIIVTGGAGFIGSHLTNALLKKKHRVVVIDDLSTGKKENVNPKAKFIKSDITNFNSLLRIFKKEKPDFVFHLAAIARVPISIKDPINTSKANILGTINVFKASVDTKVKRVIFASSSSVYGNQKTLPLKETMAPNPISPYGLQKLVGEKFAKLFYDIYGLSVVSLRYFNVYGPGLDFNSDYSLVLGKFLRQNRQRKPLTIFGDGKQTRAFCYIDDVVSANIKAMFAKKIKGGEVINIGSKESNSINKLANLIGGKVKHFPVRKGDVLHTKADIKLAKRLLQWQSTVSFDKGIKKTKEWFYSIN